jgi:putative flippase GtrA
MKSAHARLARYAVVGIATFAIYLGAGQLLDGRGLTPAGLASIAFTAAVTVNYLLQRAWVFEDSRPVSMSLPRYVAMVGMGYAVNAAAFAMLASVLPLIWAQTASASLVVLSNAALSFAWVFRAHSSTTP